jgi:DNA processing protein
MLPDIGPVFARKLLSVFSTPEKVFMAGIDDLLSVEGIGMQRARKIKGFSSWQETDRQISLMESEGIMAITTIDLNYPEMLRETDGAPVVLYAKGQLKPQDKYAFALVGSRKPTPYGVSVAETISERLASMGFTIVSGMARGIDAAAHRGVLRSGGRTIAVLGSGLDVPYPPEHKGLMQKIASSGVVFSELLPGAPPDKENFPKRNRLISGLSLGVLVVEATAKSGSLITAGYALEQGREVFAVPGNITSVNAQGTNELIRKGAVLTRNAEDIVEELAPLLKGFIRSDNSERAEISEEEKKISAVLSGEPSHIDAISRQSSLPASRVLGLLLGLELKGIVRQTTGKRFYLA